MDTAQRGIIQMGEKEFAEAAFYRMKSALGVDSVSEIARILDIPKSTVFNWVNRGTIPFEGCLATAQKKGVSLDWLFLGREQSTDSTRLEALEAENAQLRAENQRLRRETAETGRPRIEAKPELWGYLEAIAEHGPIKTAELAQMLGEAEGKVGERCLMLFRRGTIFHSQEGWMVVEGAILRADREEEVETALSMAMREMEERIVPRARKLNGIVVMADVSVAGDMPGSMIMSTIHEAVARLENENGTAMRLVIGVAPLLEND